MEQTYNENSIIELMRRIAIGMKEPKLSNRTLNVTEVAEALGKNPMWVRMGIISGWLPIGVATRDGEKVDDIKQIGKGRIDYTIYPRKLWEVTGVVI